VCENITTDLAIAPAEDEDRHDLSAFPGTREAVVYMLPIPEYRCAGIIYTWVSAEGKAGASCTFFGEGVGGTVDERCDQIDVPADMNFFDWDVGGLQLRIERLFETATVSYRGERIEMEFHFEAMHPVFPFSAHRKGCPPYYASDRTEQHGMAKGFFKVDGKEFKLDHFCQRDRSWGPRIWGLNQHYKWFHATTEHVAAHFFEMQSFGRVHQLGYVFKDNHMAEITNLKHDFIFDEDMHHRSIYVVATDSSGRTTSINCERIAKFTYPVDPMIQLNESPIAVEIEGRKGSGWCEFCWNANYLEFAKQHVEYANK